MVLAWSMDWARRSRFMESFMLLLHISAHHNALGGLLGLPHGEGAVRRARLGAVAVGGDGALRQARLKLLPVPLGEAPLLGHHNDLAPRELRAVNHSPTTSRRSRTLNLERRSASMASALAESFRRTDMSGSPMSTRATLPYGLP